MPFVILPVKRKIMKRKNLLAVTALLLSLNIGAHEFWLQPQHFYFTRGDETFISFRVGEKYKGNNWVGNRGKVNQVLVYDPSCNIQNVTSKISDAQGDSLKMKFTEPGTYMVTFDGTRSLVTQPAREFNAYLKEDGLTNALLYRYQNKELNKAGREFYQRSVKTIVQVQNKTTHFCTQRTDLPLDIVPLENPYSDLEDDSPVKLTFRVYFKGAPLKNETVKIWHSTTNDKTEYFEIKTNENGDISPRITHEGSWLVSCVYMERSVEPAADWLSYWGTVTFGYPTRAEFAKINAKAANSSFADNSK
jgi:uncharacterized GH25 family protein